MTAQEYFEEHGINDSSIKKFGITFDKRRITIPIKDPEGNVLYNKYRNLDFDKEKDGTPKYQFDEGSQASLFNIDILKDNNYVFLTEGEIDCIRLDQEGIAAITNTSGASTFKDEWVKDLEGKKVYVIYDNDKAGEEGAEKVMEKIPTAFPIHLPEGFNDVCEYFFKNSKNDFRDLVENQVKENTITYKDLCDVIDKWLLLPDKNVIRILLATLVSHFFSTDPLWMFFVAPPSGSKTEIISTAGTLPFVRMLSDLTPQTFASGMNAKKDPSLLLQLKNDVLMMKDFTTVLAMRSEDRQIILGQLREIYDGKYSKAFGTGKTIEWEGRLTLIAGVTPIIDTYSGVFQIMGERFVMYRIPQARDVDVAIKALSNYGSEKIMREELRTAMRKYFMSIDIPHVLDIELPEEILLCIAYLASFIVKARSGLVRDSFKHELQFIPETEAPARIAKQLGTLIKALAVLEKRRKVNWRDYYMTLHVALDIIPSNRMRHILALSELPNAAPSLTTTQVAQKTDYSKTGSEIILEDLTALQVVQAIRGGTGTPNEWKLSNIAKEYWKEILPKENEKALYEIFPEGSNYYPLIKEMIKSAIPITEEEVEADAWETVQQLDI